MPDADAHRDVSVKGTHGSQTSRGPEDRDCGTCGASAVGGPERFAEVFCSEVHADEFAREVRAARVQAAATRTGAEVAACTATAAGRRGWSRLLGTLLCWGGAALGVLIVGVLAFGGGGLLVGAAAVALPLIAALACPIGMYLMMRAMARTPHDERARDGHTPR